MCQKEKAKILESQSFRLFLVKYKKTYVLNLINQNQCTYIYIVGKVKKDGHPILEIFSAFYVENIV